MKHIINKYLLVTLLAAMPYLAYADVPDTISFQGYLSDDSGNAVNGTTDITFSIVDTDWNEEHNNVPVNNGVFSVQLGSETAFGNSVDFSKAPKWLEMTFENGSSQRVQFSTVPYAFHAQTVEKKKFDQSQILAQILAQASCTALKPSGGWTFAVQRECGSSAPSCDEVCKSLKEGQAGQLSCFNSLHIYANQPFTSTAELGLKVHKYNGCGGGCGPNYCCCGN